MKFGVDSDGNYGYIKAGADTVTPFKTTGCELKQWIPLSDNIKFNPIKINFIPIGKYVVVSAFGGSLASNCSPESISFIGNNVEIIKSIQTGNARGGGCLSIATVLPNEELTINITLRYTSSGYNTQMAYGIAVFG